MEIKASQRRTPARSARPLHERLARRHLQQQRLLHGGVLALASSLIAWLLGLPLPLHLALVGLAFVAGFFWRFRSAPRRARRWAFSWIESRSGLGYLTATELPEGDPYGLGAAVRARAARVNPDAPPLQPWFLPLIVTALMLALVPHLALPTLRAPFAPPVQPNEATPPPPEESAFGLEDDATTQDATPTETAAPPETGLPAEPEAARTPDAERSFDTAGSADEELGEAQGEQAALNRFLEETEAAERGGARTQQGPAGTAAPTQSGSQSPRQGGTQGSGEGQQSAQGTSQEDAETAAGENTRPQQEGGTASEGEASSGQNQNPSEAEGEGQAGQERGDAGLSDIGPDDAAENTGEEERTASEGPEAPQEEPNTGETQQAGSAQQQQNEQQTGQQESPASTGAPAAQGSTSESDPAARDLREGQSSQRAGSRPGAEVKSSRERLGESSSTPERIPGIRGAGPTTTGGEALQQGRAPETLPRTGSAQSYRRAAEEVIREGRIPLEYQEIVRDYFR